MTDEEASGELTLGRMVQPVFEDVCIMFSDLIDNPEYANLSRSELRLICEDRANDSLDLMPDEASYDELVNAVVWAIAVASFKLEERV